MTRQPLPFGKTPDDFMDYFENAFLYLKMTGFLLSDSAYWSGFPVMTFLHSSKILALFL